MATSISNGSSSGKENLTPAQQLMAKHDEVHQPSIEDVVDEDDVAHPPPSSKGPGPLSEKAAGKQKAQEPAAGASKQRAEAKLDTASEEAFPSLAKPRPSNVVPSAWGKKPAATTGGTNGTSNGASGASSRASTPASSMFTPAPSQASGRPVDLPLFSLPGQHKDSIALEQSQMKPRSELRKPVKDFLKDIEKSLKVKIDYKEAAGNKIMFQAVGPQRENVHKALREVASQLGSKQVIKVPIPASTRAHVIGRQGATIQAIQKKTGARVNISKQDAPAPSSADDDDSATIDVVIEGDAIAASLARDEVERIVNERTSTVNLRLKHIPPEYYPFLAGAHNSIINSLEGKGDIRLQIPQYHTFEQAPPQVPEPGQPLSFTPRANYPIQISGDRIAAQQARDALERRFAQLQQQLAMRQEPVQRGRHQFIVGERGSSLNDFMQETGCSLILPPAGHDDETIYVIGPPDRLDEGVNKVLDLAGSMAFTNANFPRQWSNDHARSVNRYLQQRQAIQKLEEAHNASIVADGPAWEIYSRDTKDGMKARADILNLLNSHPPTRLVNLDANRVHPFYHQHICDRHAQDIRDQYGVHLLSATDEEPQLILVYEGPGSPSDYQLPRGQPSPQEIKAFQQALQKAQQHILQLISQQQEIVNRDLDAPSKFHDKIRRWADKEQSSLPEGRYPVELLFGSQGARTAPQGGFSVRGPSDRVDDIEAKLRAFIEEQHKDELERGYTTTFDFPQKFANFLIGKHGDNIKKLRDEFDVEIQVNDGKVELKGPQAKCASCKSHILSNLKRWEDETTYVLKVDPKHHRDLIGPKGSSVNKLQDRYNVQINFPRSHAPVSDDADASTEASAPRRNSRNQAPDEVVIRGPKRGADEAKEELLNFLQYLVDNSHTTTVSVAQTQLPSLIGAGGREIDNIRMQTKAMIDFPSANSPTDSAGRVQIKIKGSKEAVAAAKELLEERAKVFDDTVVKTIDIDKKHHKSLIGGNGANIRNIIVAAGGPDDRRDIARMVRFPRQDSDENTIRVEGNKAIVDKIIKSLQDAANEKDSQTTEVLEVAPEKHRVLIGRGGDVRKGMETQFNCTIDIPKQNTTGAARSQVKITGQPTDVKKAKEHIFSLIKDQEGETVTVPRNLHHVISNNGQFFRNLRNNHSVTVDHGDHKPPPKPTAASGARARVNGGALPLITDDAPTSSHSWEIVDANTSDETGEIPWILRGSPDNVTKARSLLEQALDKAKQPSATGYLILPDPRSYRLVVGPGGSNINNIRKKTGTQVTVPRDQKQGEAIEIVGPREGVEEAKEIILELVQNNGGRKG